MTPWRTSGFMFYPSVEVSEYNSLAGESRSYFTENTSCFLNEDQSVHDIYGNGLGLEESVF